MSVFLRHWSSGGHQVQLSWCGHLNIPVYELFFSCWFFSVINKFSCLVRKLRSTCRRILILIHPKRKADHGGTAPHWLGAAQLEVGDSCPMWCEDLFHRWKQPLKLHYTPIEHCNLQPVVCCLPCYFVSVRRCLFVLFRAQASAGWCRGHAVAQVAGPHSPRQWLIQRSSRADTAVDEVENVENCKNS